MAHMESHIFFILALGVVCVMLDFIMLCFCFANSKLTYFEQRGGNSEDLE